MDSVCVDLREKGLSGEEKGRKSEVEMDGQCVCVDLRETGLSGDEKGRKSEVEMDGQCVCGLEGEGTVGGGEGKEE